MYPAVRRRQRLKRRARASLRYSQCRGLSNISAILEIDLRNFLRRWPKLDCGFLKTMLLIYSRGNATLQNFSPASYNAMLPPWSALISDAHHNLRKSTNHVARVRGTRQNACRRILRVPTALVSLINYLLSSIQIYIEKTCRT